MNRKVCAVLIAIIGLQPAMSCAAQLTLDYCQEKARENYPMLKKYGIVEQMEALDLSDVNKGWLPQATLYGQGTIQNAVPAFPEALRGVLAQMGQEFKGLGKFQYKIGLDVNQTIWDGGVSKSRRASARAEALEQSAALDVQLYGLNEKVQGLFFGILLIEEQIKQTEETLGVIDANLGRLRAMLQNGTAMQSDVDMLEAQGLTIGQQLTAARGSALQYREALGILMGEDVTADTFDCPGAELPADMTSARPELKLFEARSGANDVRKAAVKASLMPRIGLFASIYEGYPGFDYFASMRDRSLSFNAMAGVKVSWNISSLYDRKNSLNRIRLAEESVEVDRQMFMRDTELSVSKSRRDIETMRKTMADDSRIVALRANVRNAAESQLSNGVIDATDLLAKISDENQARLNSAYHQIRLTQMIYAFKNILNR